MPRRARFPFTAGRAARLALAAAAIPAALLAGCYTEAGFGVSRDVYTYVSRAHDPVTITIVDTRTGEEVWAREIPVNRKLVIRFLDGKGEENQQYPDLMLWEEMDPGRKGGHLPNKVAVPSTRRIDYTLRRRPELPEEMLARTPGEAPIELRGDEYQPDQPERAEPAEPEAEDGSQTTPADEGDGGGSAEAGGTDEGQNEPGGERKDPPIDLEDAAGGDAGDADDADEA